MEGVVMQVGDKLRRCPTPMLPDGTVFLDETFPDYWHHSPPTWEVEAVLGERVQVASMNEASGSPFQDRLMMHLREAEGLFVPRGALPSEQVRLRVGPGAIPAFMVKPALQVLQRLMLHGDHHDYELVRILRRHCSSSLWPREGYGAAQQVRLLVAWGWVDAVEVGRYLQLRSNEQTALALASLKEASL